MFVSHIVVKSCLCCVCDERDTHFVFVYNPAPGFLVLALVESFILDDLVHRYVFEPRGAGELLGVRGLAHARCACDDDVWVVAHHCVFGCV